MAAGTISAPTPQGSDQKLQVALRNVGGTRARSPRCRSSRCRSPPQLSAWSSSAEPVIAWVQARTGSELFTTSITLAEILYGIARQPNGRRKERWPRAT